MERKLGTFSVHLMRTKKEERDWFEHLWCWNWGDYPSFQLSLGQIHGTWIRTLSNLWEESDTSISWLGLVQDKLGLSSCARPCSSVCVGIQLPHVQVVTAHSHAVRSYPLGRYFMAMPVWGGSYQNIMIYVCHFVVLFNGSKCLCRKTLSSGGQGCYLNHCQLTILEVGEAENSILHFLQRKLNLSY